MATDYQLIIQRLLGFAELAGRTVIAVGAGGGQLIEYGRSAAGVIAVDQDPAALEALQARLEAAGLADRSSPIRCADAASLTA